MQPLTCNMQHVACNMQQAALSYHNGKRRALRLNFFRCPPRHATSDIRHGTCDIRLATCDLQHATCNMRWASTSSGAHPDIRLATCDMQHALRPNFFRFRMLHVACRGRYMCMCVPVCTHARFGPSRLRIYASASASPFGRMLNMKPPVTVEDLNTGSVVWRLERVPAGPGVEPLAAGDLHAGSGLGR